MSFIIICFIFVKYFFYYYFIINNYFNNIWLIYRLYIVKINIIKFDKLVDILIQVDLELLNFVN